MRTGPIAPLAAGVMLILVPAASAGAPLASGGPAPSPPPVVHYAAPLPPSLRVLTAFDPPATPYGPGHRGVDLAATPHEVVRAAGPGTVTFAGPVAGRGVVVIAHPDGIRTEYEPVRPLVHAGDAVPTGTQLGVVQGRHASCAPATCLHWGARRGSAYIDPLGLLRSLGPVRLLPWRGR